MADYTQLINLEKKQKVQPPLSRAQKNTSPQQPLSTTQETPPSAPSWRSSWTFVRYAPGTCVRFRRIVKGEKEAKATGGKRAWGLAGGESGAARVVCTPRAKNATMQAFLLPTPHLLRLYHLFSFFSVLSGCVSACRSYRQAGPHAQRVNAQSKFPP